MDQHQPRETPAPEPNAAGASPTGEVGRRDLLRVAGAAAFGALAVPLLADTASAAGGKKAGAKLDDAKLSPTRVLTRPKQPITPAATATTSTFTPLPPATPLIVRSPYLNTWQAADELVGTWPSFWNGHTTGMCGIARIDGTAYQFAGDATLPSGPALGAMTQVSLTVTATSSIYTFTAGGVDLTVTFLSPVDPGNLQRQCVPFGYVTFEVVSTTSATHTVEVYFDISGEWADGDTAVDIGWAQTTTSSTIALTNAPTDPGVLEEYKDQASWGTVVIASPTSSNLTWQIGEDQIVRAQAAASGALADSVDPNQPRAISDDWPVFGFCYNFGPVGSTAPATPFQVVIGHVRTPAISFLGSNLQPWWTTYWSSWEAMVDWLVADYSSALSSAPTIDQQIQTDATNLGGSDYAAICALALRQAFGGTELVDYNGSPWVFLKEISSNDCVSTVDVVYPASPAYLYMSPAYLQALLEPLIYFAENGWINVFAEHDLGMAYPVADGDIADGKDGQEDMPIEESGNMLIMAAAVLQRIPAAQATAWAQQHYAIFHQWAEYLQANTLHPALQNQTDDFTGKIANSVNLAVKGIIGLGAMSIIAGFAGNTADEAAFLDTAFSYISQWVSLGEDPANASLDLAYADSNTWSLKYNCYPDRMLGLGMVPLGIATQEGQWYASHAGTYGVLLDPRNDYTKADWEIWTAGRLAELINTGNAGNILMSGVYGFLQNTPNRVPFSDLYVVSSADQVSFENRPVVGGMFTLTRVTPAANSTTWYKIQNYNSGLVLAVNDMSLADSADVTQWTDNGTYDHLWTQLQNSDGSIRFANRNSGKVLAVNGMSLADGAYVQQYQDDGTSDHNWTLVSAGSGLYKIVNQHSGKVMAVNGQSTAAGAQVTQYDDNGTPDHLWSLIAP